MPKCLYERNMEDNGLGKMTFPLCGQVNPFCFGDSLVHAWEQVSIWNDSFVSSTGRIQATPCQRASASGSSCLDPSLVALDYAALNPVSISWNPSWNSPKWSQVTSGAKTPTGFHCICAKTKPVVVFQRSNISYSIELSTDIVLSCDSHQWM